MSALDSYLQNNSSDNVAYYHLLLPYISDIVIALDKHFHITAWNKAAENFYGYSEKDVLGKDITTIIPALVVKDALKVGSLPAEDQIKQLNSHGELYYFNRVLIPLNNNNPAVSSCFIILKKIPGKPPEQLEEKYRLLVEQANDGVFVFDKNWRCIEVNSSACSMSGYTKDELLQMPIIQLLAPEELPLPDTRFSDLEKAGILLTQRKLVRKDGSAYYVEAITQLMSDGKAIAFVHDITDKKKADFALQESEEKYRLLIEQAQDGIFIGDLTGRLMLVNSMACSMTGYTKEELLTMNVFDLIPEDRHQEAMQYVEEMMKSKISKVEGAFQRKDGSLIYIESFSRITPQDMVVSFCRDITEKRKAAIALQESEEKYRQLFQHSPLPMFVLDLNTLVFKDVNAAAVKHYGYTKEEFLAMTAMDIRPEEDLEKFYEGVRMSIIGLVNVGLFRHRKKDGAIMDMEIYLHDFLFQNDRTRLVLAVDITEKLNTEKGLLQTTQQLRELSAHLQNIREEERARISREIHDELGQQLTILKMDVSWIYKRLKKLGDKSLLQKTEDTLGMMDDTIRTIRRIATELRPSMLDDLGLVAALEWQSKEFENRSGISIRFCSGLGELPIPSSAATSMFRIYQEALTNIGRHAGAQQVSAELKLLQNQLVLSVIDDGRGFDINAPGHTKTLGLLGMKERALIMGGQFEINSVPGKGTTIVVTIPLQAE